MYVEPVNDTVRRVTGYDGMLLIGREIHPKVQSTGEEMQPTRRKLASVDMI